MLSLACSVWPRVPAERLDEGVVGFGGGEIQGKSRGLRAPGLGFVVWGLGSGVW